MYYSANPRGAMSPYRQPASNYGPGILPPNHKFNGLPTYPTGPAQSPIGSGRPQLVTYGPGSRPGDPVWYKRPEWESPPWQRPPVEVNPGMYPHYSPAPPPQQYQGYVPPRQDRYQSYHERYPGSWTNPFSQEYDERIRYQQQHPNRRGGYYHRPSRVIGRHGGGGRIVVSPPDLSYLNMLR